MPLYLTERFYLYVYDWSDLDFILNRLEYFHSYLKFLLNGAVAILCAASCESNGIYDLYTYFFFIFIHIYIDILDI